MGRWGRLIVVSLAMDVANETTVLGNFNDAEFTLR